MLAASLANYQNGLPKVAEKPLLLGRTGTQLVVMVTKRLSSRCRAYLVKSYCKESNVSEVWWPRTANKKFTYFCGINVSFSEK